MYLELHASADFANGLKNFDFDVYFVLGLLGELTSTYEDCPLDLLPEITELADGRIYSFATLEAPRHICELIQNEISWVPLVSWRLCFMGRYIILGRPWKRFGMRERIKF